MVAARMLAVRMVYVRKAGIDETAAHLMRSARWVRNWLHRYDEGGLENLRDLPRSDRPRRIPRETIEQIINKTVQSKCAPAGLQKCIHEETGTKLHITYIRKIMCMYNLSPKESQRVHINRTGKKAVQNWQYRFKKQVSRLEKDGFISVMGDEAFIIHDTVSGRKYWSPRGKRIAVPYTGSYKKVAVYGAIAKEDGRQFFRTYDRFDAPTFIEYLKAMQRHFGKIVTVVDKASPHRAKSVKELLWENKNIKIIYLPKRSPYLNAVEKCWRRGKQVLLVSEYYKTFTDMCSAISTYYRTARFTLDILKFANRKAALFCMNL